MFSSLMKGRGALLSAAVIGASGAAAGVLEYSTERDLHNENDYDERAGLFFWRRLVAQSQPDGGGTLNEDRKAGKLDNPDDGKISARKMRLIFLGTGSSMGTPYLKCLLDDEWKSLPRCETSRLAMEGRPEDNRNYRNSPSLCVQLVGERDDGVNVNENILIDCGKHFRQAAIQYLPKNNVKKFTSIVLTHEHADAMIGLDDVRLVQAAEPANLYVASRHFIPVKTKFGYLLPEVAATKESTSETKVVRFTAHLRPSLFDSFDIISPMNDFNFDMECVPLEHGSDYTCFGFIFGSSSLGKRVAYLSDVSVIPPETMASLKEEKLDLLILDALSPQEHATHLSLPESLDIIRELKPRRALLVGIGGRIEHFSTNAELRRLFPLENGIDVQLAHDGLVVEFEESIRKMMTCPKKQKKINFFF